MSGQALTFEGILALFLEDRERMREFREQSERNERKSDRAFRKMRRAMKESADEFDRRMAEQKAEYDRISKATNKKIGDLTDNMGRVIERMVAGQNIAKQFQEKFGYIIESHSRNKTFGEDLPEGNQGEIDLFLENGDIAILIEVKTTLKAKNVGSLKDKLEKFRREADSKGDKRRFIGAVAGAVVEGDAKEVAHENGMYVIVQSGKAVEILPTSEGFEARKW